MKYKCGDKIVVINALDNSYNRKFKIKNGQVYTIAEELGTLSGERNLYRTFDDFCLYNTEIQLVSEVDKEWFVLDKPTSIDDCM